MAMLEAAERPISYPSWTEYRSRNGLDPLGMQNSCIGLYQTLLAGIGNVTLCVRYYGLYAWLARTYAKIDGSTDPEDWRRFLRRSEALYALVAFHADDGVGVAGIQWAAEAYATTDDPIVFSGAADPDGGSRPYLRQKWGAYGAAYGGQLFAIDVLWESPDHDIPLPSGTFGELLADAFADSIGGLADDFLEIVERGEVYRSELDRLVSISPGAIEEGSTESMVLQELLFSPQGALDTAGQSRRSSLLLVLKVAELLGRIPNDQEVRWVLYAGQDEEGRKLSLVDNRLELQRQRWWVYQANDLCHVALEALLKFALDTLEQIPGGATFDELAARCVDRILPVMDRVPATWSDLLAATVPLENAYADSDTAEWSLCQLIIRSAGRKDHDDCSPETAWCAVRLLAVLHNRARNEDHPLKQELGSLDPETFRTLLSEVRFLEANGTAPFRETLAKVLVLRVLRRHLWVAARKFQAGDYTFLLESDDGRIRVRSKDGPMLTTPRLRSAIAFLQDIHLLADGGLSDLGTEVLKGE